MNDICDCGHFRWRHKLHIYVYKNKNIKKFGYCHVCMNSKTCKQFKLKSKGDK